MYIESDSKTNTKGLVERVSDMDGRLNELEDDKKKIKAKITIISTFAGFLIVLGKELFNRVFPHG